MKLKQIIHFLEAWAPLAFQESYDNCGLLYGDVEHEITQALITLEITEAVVDEAIATGSNLIIAHHPLIFKGLKQLHPTSDDQRALIKAIQSDIAIYAIHTNLDHVHTGVNAAIAEKLHLKNTQILSPKTNLLQKLIVFAPSTHSNQILNALFEAGAGQIGNYSECSFQTTGMGSFKPNDLAKPFVGTVNDRHQEPEIKLEVLIPNYLQSRILQALKQNHPYEEVAYDLLPLNNTHPLVGSGLVGTLQQPISEVDFIQSLKAIFQVPIVRHTALLGRPIQKIAVCGGSGSFLINTAKRAGADLFLSADIKYHEFFQAEKSLVIADIGHYETESPIKQQIYAELTKKFPIFAVRVSQINTNPINYS